MPTLKALLTQAEKLQPGTKDHLISQMRHRAKTLGRQLTLPEAKVLVTQIIRNKQK